MQRKNITTFIRDIKNVTADLLADGNKSKAKKLLEGDLNDMTRGDLCVISFLSGAIIILILIIILFLSFRNRFLDD